MDYFGADYVVIRVITVKETSYTKPSPIYRYCRHYYGSIQELKSLKGNLSHKGNHS